MLLDGWIPRDERTIEQQRQSDAWAERTPTFGQVCGTVSLPEHALLYDLEKKATGKLCNRIWQMEGSCVGAAGARSYTQTICGDIVVRGTTEEVKDIFPWATWGIGRRMGGLNSRGGGSFGSVQARAVSEWGMLAADDPRLPQPKNRDGWLVWSSKIELDFSTPRTWSPPESELAPAAGEHKMGYTAQIKTWDELLQAFAQGYGVTCASMYGTRPAVSEGFLIGPWNGSWAHQMSWSGYYTHPTLGPLIAVDNQWGPQAHPSCPFLSAMGVRGSFWITEGTTKKILGKSDAEVYAHGDTQDWKTRIIDWGSVGMG